MRVEARNAKLAQKQNLMVDMDPAIADAFLKSSFVSRTYNFFNLSYRAIIYILLYFLLDSKGSAANLCKPTAKRRATRAEIQAREVQQEVKQAAEEEQKQRIQDL